MKNILLTVVVAIVGFGAILYVAYKRNIKMQHNKIVDQYNSMVNHCDALNNSVNELLKTQETEQKNSFDNQCTMANFECNEIIKLYEPKRMHMAQNPQEMMLLDFAYIFQQQIEAMQEYFKLPEEKKLEQLEKITAFENQKDNLAKQITKSTK